MALDSVVHTSQTKRWRELSGGLHRHGVPSNGRPVRAGMPVARPDLCRQVEGLRTMKRFQRALAAALGMGLLAGGLLVASVGPVAAGGYGPVAVYQVELTANVTGPHG